MTRREHGYTMSELMLVTTLAVPVVLSLASVVQHLRASARTMELQSDRSEQRERLVRALACDLRSASRIVEDPGASQLELASARGRVQWRLANGVLSASGARRLRVQGVRALHVERDGRLVRVEIRWRDGSSSVVTSQMRGGDA